MVTRPACMLPSSTCDRKWPMEVSVSVQQALLPHKPWLFLPRRPCGFMQSVWGYWRNIWLCYIFHLQQLAWEWGQQSFWSQMFVPRKQRLACHDFGSLRPSSVPPTVSSSPGWATLAGLSPILPTGTCKLFDAVASCMCSVLGEGFKSRDPSFPVIYFPTLFTLHLPNYFS